MYFKKGQIYKILNNSTSFRTKDDTKNNIVFLKEDDIVLFLKIENVKVPIPNSHMTYNTKETIYFLYNKIIVYNNFYNYDKLDWRRFKKNFQRIS